MFARIREYVTAERLLEEGDAVVMGVSGGADSVCLFLCLNWLAGSMGLRLAVAHVDHGIRKAAAKEDAAFVRELCAEHGVPFYLEEADVPALARQWGLGEEEAGRLVRHRAYASCAKKLFSGRAKIALGHHQDDVAETVLLALIRGAGLNGLAGIRPLSYMTVGGDTLTIVRPLLGVGREEIEEQLSSAEVQWRSDATNGTDDYTRNRIRHYIMPLLSSENPAAVRHIARTAQLCGQAQDYLAGEGEKKRRALARDAGGLEKEGLRALHPALRSEVIRQWLADDGPGERDIGAVHIEAVQRLSDSPPGKQAVLPHGFTAISGYEDIRLYRQDADKAAMRLQKEELCLSKPLPGGCREAVFGGYRFVFSAKKADEIPIEAWKQENAFSIFINYDKIDKICLRFPQGGERIVISREGTRKKLTRLLIDAKVPREQRRTIPLMTDGGGNVIWVVGVRDCPVYFVDDKTRLVLTCHVRKDIAE